MIEVIVMLGECSGIMVSGRASNSKLRSPGFDRNNRVIHIYNGKSVTKVYYVRLGCIL